MSRRAFKRPAGQDPPRWRVKEHEEEVGYEEFLQSWQPLPPEQDYYFSSYARYGIHEDMLKDEVRTGSYLEAIESSEALFKGKTVLDVGSGTGILCLFAAQAGAKRVIGIERSDVAMAAQKIAVENGFGEVITYVQGKVEEVELPVEKVDIIVSEWMGYFLLFESMLDCVLFARDKWLHAGGRMFPDTARLYLAAIEDAEYKEEKLGLWRHIRGFDFSAVAELALQEPLVDVVEPSALVTEGQCVLEMDLNKVSCSALDFVAPFCLKVLRQDFVHALVVWFDVHFDASHAKTVLTTSPGQPDTHWKQTVLYLAEPLVVFPNDEIRGRIGVRKNQVNFRDLDVKLAYELSGRRPQAERVQGFRIR